MLKLIARLSAIALISGIITEDAFAASRRAPSLPRAFVGVYQGGCQLSSPTGDVVLYLPLRITISKKGIVTGTANRESGDMEVPNTLLKVKGRTKMGRGGNARFNLKFEDGVKVTGSIRKWTTFGQTSVQADVAKAKAGEYLGTCVLND